MLENDLSKFAIDFDRLEVRVEELEDQQLIRGSAWSGPKQLIVSLSAIIPVILGLMGVAAYFWN